MVNTCIRCGKARIIIEKWEEEIKQDSRSTIITHFQSVCPDAMCQREVEKMLERDKVKDDERRQEKYVSEQAAKIEREKRTKKLLTHTKSKSPLK